jgi:hypothetical protein
VEHVPVQLVESFGSKGCVFKLDKTHRTVLFGAETKSFVPTLLGEDGFQFVFGSVHGQIADIECVAWRVLVSRVDRRVCRSRKMLRILLVATAGRVAQCRRDSVRGHCRQGLAWGLHVGSRSGRGIVWQWRRAHAIDAVSVQRQRCEA